MRCSSDSTVSVLSTERASGAHWFICKTSDAAHCSRNSEGKLRPEAKRAEILERVRCATGSSSTTSIGVTLGGGVANFGAMSFSVLGVGPCQERRRETEPSRKCWSVFGVGEIFMLSRRVISRIELVGAPQFDLGAGGEGDVIVGGAGELLKRSRSLDMAVSCSWWMVAGEYLTAQERKLRAWTMWSLSVTVSWVRYSCRTLTLSENRRSLVAPSTTWKQR